MKNIISVLQDVSALVTHGSDIARTEVRRIEAQREHKAAECRQSLSNQPAVVAAQVVEHIQGHHRSGQPFVTGGNAHDSFTCWQGANEPAHDL